MAVVDLIVAVHGLVCMLSWRSCKMVSKMKAVKPQDAQKLSLLGWIGKKHDHYVILSYRGYPVLYCWSFLLDIPFVVLTAVSCVFVWRIPDVVTVLRQKHRIERTVNWRLVGVANIGFGMLDVLAGIGALLVTVTLWRLPKMMRDIRSAREQYAKLSEHDKGVRYNTRARAAVGKCALLVFLDILPALAWVMCLPWVWRWRSMHDSCRELHPTEGKPECAPAYDSSGEKRGDLPVESRVQRLMWHWVGTLNFIAGLADVLVATSAVILLVMPWRLRKAVLGVKAAKQKYQLDLRCVGCSERMRYNSVARWAVLREVLLAVTDLVFLVLGLFVLATVFRMPRLVERVRLIQRDTKNRHHDTRGWLYHNYRTVIVKEAAKVLAVVVMLPLLLCVLLSVYRLPVCVSEVRKIRTKRRERRRQSRAAAQDVECSVREPTTAADAPAYSAAEGSVPAVGTPPPVADASLYSAEGSVPAAGTPPPASEVPVCSAESSVQAVGTPPPAAEAPMCSASADGAAPSSAPTPPLSGDRPLCPASESDELHRASINWEADDSASLKQAGVVCFQAAQILVDVPCAVAGVLTFALLWRSARLCSELRRSPEWGGEETKPGERGTANHNRIAALVQLGRTLLDIPCLILLVIIAGTLYRLPGTLKAIFAKTTARPDPTPVLALTSVVSEFTPGQGWVLCIKGKCPPGFNFKLARLKVEGKQFWASFGRGIGRLHLAVVERFMPISICPRFLDPETVCTSGDFEAKIHIRVTVKRTTIIKKLRLCDIDAPICVSVEYASQDECCASMEGTLFTLSTTVRELIDKEETGASVDLPPAPDVLQPVDPSKQQRVRGEWFCDVFWKEVLWSAAQLPFDALCLVMLVLLLCCVWRAPSTKRQLCDSDERKRQARVAKALLKSAEALERWPDVLRVVRSELCNDAKNSYSLSASPWTHSPEELRTHFDRLEHVCNELELHAPDQPEHAELAARAAECQIAQLFIWWDCICRQLLLLSKGPGRCFSHTQLHSVNPDSALQAWSWPRSHGAARHPLWDLGFRLTETDAEGRPMALTGRRALHHLTEEDMQPGAETVPEWQATKLPVPAPVRPIPTRVPAEPVAPVHIVGVLAEPAHASPLAPDKDAADQMQAQQAEVKSCRTALLDEHRRALQDMAGCTCCEHGWGSLRFAVLAGLGDACLDVLAFLLFLVLVCCVWRSWSVVSTVCTAGRRWRRECVLQAGEVGLDFLYFMGWVLAVVTVKYAVQLQVLLLLTLCGERSIEACRNTISKVLRHAADDLCFMFTVLLKVRTWRYFVVTLLTGVFAPAESLSQTFDAVDSEGVPRGGACQAVLLLGITAMLVAYPFVLSMVLAGEGETYYKAGIAVFGAVQLLLLLYSIAAQFRAAFRPGSGAEHALSPGVLHWRDGRDDSFLDCSDTSAGMFLRGHTQRHQKQQVCSVSYCPADRAISWTVEQCACCATAVAVTHLPTGADGDKILTGVRLRAERLGLPHDISESVAPTPPHPLLRLHGAPVSFIRASWYNCLPVLAVLLETAQLIALPMLFEPSFGGDTATDFAQAMYLDYDAESGKTVGLWVAVVVCGVFYVVASMPIVLEDLLDTGVGHGEVAQFPGWAFLSYLLSSLLYPLVLRSLVAAVWCPDEKGACVDGAGWGLVALLCLTLYVPACALRGTKVRSISPDVDVAFVELYNLMWTGTMTVIVVAAEVLREEGKAAFAGVEAAALLCFCIACRRLRKHPQVPQLCSVSSIGTYRTAGQVAGLCAAVSVGIAQFVDDDSVVPPVVLFAGVGLCAIGAVCVVCCQSDTTADPRASIAAARKGMLECLHVASSAQLLTPDHGTRVGSRWRASVRAAGRVEQLAVLCLELEGALALPAYTTEFWGTRRTWREKLSHVQRASGRLWSQYDIEQLEECVAEVAASLARVRRGDVGEPAPDAEDQEPSECGSTLERGEPSYPPAVATDAAAPSAAALPPVVAPDAAAPAAAAVLPERTAPDAAVGVIASPSTEPPFSFDRQGTQDTSSLSCVRSDDGAAKALPHGTPPRPRGAAGVEL
eukprot:TRINITY_DN4080_c2_g1_i7.p1 TRINITY_DN4080_c2_g1~~TRINITY_DN4080_c2_g1_i7.p1  ORF type:complete len:2164 (+),score=253.58 TRINITY_DN4080_c2_g1_i7:361-6492(+)